MAGRTFSQAHEDYKSLKDALDKPIVVSVEGVEGINEATKAAEQLRAAMARTSKSMGQVSAPSSGGSAIGESIRAEASNVERQFRLMYEKGQQFYANFKNLRARGTGGPNAGGSSPGDSDKKGDGPGSGIGSGAEKGVKYMLKQLGIGKAAMAAFSVAGALELSKLAMGYRGMATLGALGQRAAFQFRRLFTGVDPTPVLRAASRLFSLVDGSTQTGKSLQRIFTTAFTSIFGAVESVEPKIRWFFKELVIGAQDIEIAWLRLRVAVKPLTDALADLAGPIGELMGPIDGINTGLETSASDFREIAEFARAAADAVRDFRSALDAANKGTFLINAKQNLGMISADEAARQRVAAGAPAHSRTGDNAFDDALARKEARQAAEVGAPDAGGKAPGQAKASGAATGKAYADGIVEGAKAGTPAVGSAGEAIAKALDAGTRKAGEIHSPSKLAARTGREFPAGTAQGIDAGSDDVQAAAARSMVPRVGAARGTASASGVTVNITNNWPDSIASAKREELAAMVETIINNAVRAAVLQLGVQP